MYRSEVEAREALGHVIQGAWKERHVSNVFALVVYRCPVRKARWHIGHNPKAVEAFPKLLI